MLPYEVDATLAAGKTRERFDIHNEKELYTFCHGDILMSNPKFNLLANYVVSYSKYPIS